MTHPNSRPAPARGLSRGGFTLIELLAVVAVIGILAALLSSAIVQMMKESEAKRNANNADILRSAIVAYRHDEGHWPVPDKAEPKKDVAGAGNYGLRYGDKGDNAVVVERLLKIGTGKNRDRLDLHGFTALDDENAKQETVMVTVSEYDKRSLVVWSEADAGRTVARDAWAASEPSANGAHRVAPTLVWMARLYWCKHCESFQTDTTCNYHYCPYREKHGAPFRIPKTEVSRFAIPYKILFDFTNDRVSVYQL